MAVLEVADIGGRSSAVGDIPEFCYSAQRLKTCLPWAGARLDHSIRLSSVWNMLLPVFSRSSARALQQPASREQCRLRGTVGTFQGLNRGSVRNLPRSTSAGRPFLPEPCASHGQFDR